MSAWAHFSSFQAQDNDYVKLSNIDKGGSSASIVDENTSQSSKVSDINSNYGLDEYTLKCLEIFTNCFMINVVCCFGIIGNVINIAVLRHHGFRDTTNIILVSLSMSDLMFCVVVPATKLRCTIKLFNDAASISVHTFVTVYLFMPKYVCLASSCCYVSVIAIERFVAVFFPFHVSKIFKRSIMKWIVVSVPIITGGSLIPTFFALTYDWIYDSRFNITIVVMRYTEFYVINQNIIDPYTWVGLSNGFCASSITVVTACCLAIGFKVTRSAIKRELMTRRAAGNDKVVKMLVMVCVIYIVVAIPTVTLYSYFQPNFIFVSPLYELVDNFGVLLSSINASANFVVYVTMSDKFARTYKMMLSCSKSKFKKHSTYP